MYKNFEWKINSVEEYNRKIYIDLRCTDDDFKALKEMYVFLILCLIAV